MIIDVFLIKYYVWNYVMFLFQSSIFPTREDIIVSLWV